MMPENHLREAGREADGVLLDLSERPSPGTQVGRSLLGLAAAGFLFVCSLVYEAPLRPEEVEHQWTFRILAGLLLVASGFGPVNRLWQLDLARREVVSVLRYGDSVLRRTRQALDEFGSVLLRHVAHEGEGSTCYTADVGLKLVDGRPTVWLRSFPASEESVPPEARVFARRLQLWTGLPGRDDRLHP
ncbi:MAG: hypothetical protein HS113_07345 [Verrucomicrobiales bacterium]|nr:hypothetical protein [Verrucomicrobiales bacterium]